MELPPGFRGYGARDILDHPDTAHRQAEVDALRAPSTWEALGSTPAANQEPSGQTTIGTTPSDQAAIGWGDAARSLQERLMPFHHLLPARYQGPNARSSAPVNIQPPSPQPSPARGEGARDPVAPS